MKKFALLTLLTLLTLPAARAQQGDEAVQYTKEIGAGLGLNFMLSDMNSTWYGNSNFSVDALFRFVLNPRMAVKLELGYNFIKGSTEGVGEFYPTETTMPGAQRLSYSMSGGIVDLAAMYELHFLPYGWYRNYLGHKRITPYVQLGAGVLYSTPGKAFSVQFPIGVGLKWKVARRVNLGLDWTFRFTLSDGLDNLKDPTGISVSGFHGKDFYSKTMLTLTYDISPKCPTCNKAD